MIKAAVTALKTVHKLPESTSEDDIIKKFGSIDDAFKKDFIDKKIIEPYYLDVWKKIETMKKMSDDKKIMEVPDREVYEMREFVRKLIRDLARTLKTKEIEEEK
jgi:hypothetical protein